MTKFYEMLFYYQRPVPSVMTEHSVHQLQDNSSLIQLHVRGTSHQIQWMWLFLGHCN